MPRKSSVDIKLQDPIEKFEQFFRKQYYNKILNIAKEYPENKSLIIDYKDLDKFDVELADSLLKDPEETLKQAKDAISELDIPIETEDGYDINVRVENIPSSQEVNIRDLRSEHIDKLITIEGVVKSAAEVRPEATKAIFECPECNKEIVIPQFGKTLKTPYMCDNLSCGRRGKFNLIRTDLLDTQRIKVQEPPETIIGGEQPSQLYINLTDDLVSPEERKKVLPGNRVRLTGILRKLPFRTRTGMQTTRFDLYMDANHVNAVEQEFEEITLSKEDIKKIKKLSKNPKLFEKFISSMAPSIYGYESIKEAILLQLFGGVPKVQPDGTRIRGNIHLFLVGDPAVGKSQLLWYVSRLAPKGRFVSGKKASGVGLTAAVVRDDFAGGWTLEAGALILANNGTVSVDEFDKIGADDRSAMLEAMEQGTISVAKAGIVTTLRANTSVLAAANPKYGRFDRNRLLSEQIELSPVILSRFDLKFPIMDIPGREHDVRLSDHVVDSFTTPKMIEPEIPPDLIRKYVAYAKLHCKPKLTEHAKKAIKDFYVAWRSKYTKAEGESTIALTPRQLEALIRISEASARVRLRKEVKLDDVRRAIKLLEYSLKELGMDPETGMIDIDRIDVGTSSTQRSKIHTMFTIIDELMEETKGREVPVEDIIDEAKERGIEELSAMEVLENMKTKGDLYEPKPGFYKRVKR